MSKVNIKSFIVKNGTISLIKFIYAIHMYYYHLQGALKWVNCVDVAVIAFLHVLSVVVRPRTPCWRRQADAE